MPYIQWNPSFKTSKKTFENQVLKEGGLKRGVEIRLELLQCDSKNIVLKEGVLNEGVLKEGLHCIYKIKKIYFIF